MADIKHCIQIAANADRIYQLVSTAEGLNKWWAADVTDGAEVVELGFFNRTTVYRLRRKPGQAPGVAEWSCESGDEWSGTRLVFQLEAIESGTRLRFSHTGWRAETDYFTSCNTTWGELMFRLKAAAEGKTPGPLFSREGM